MAKKVAKFEKVSYEQFEKDWMDTYNILELDTETKRTIESVYKNIVLPKRATVGSAGYDFFCPMPVRLKPGETIKILTGIRCSMSENWVLKLYPRSGLGFKFRLQLNNTVGIIDSDYYNAENEGHIMVKITNDTNEEKTIEIKDGAGFIQGVFVEYGITVDDQADGIRNGGFGSTDSNK